MTDYEYPRTREVAGGISRFTLWAILGLAAVAVLVVLVFAFGVVTAPWAGKGNAFIQKESAQNRIESQAVFPRDFQQIKALDQKLTDAQAQIALFHKQNPNFAPNGTPYDPLAETLNNLEMTEVGIQQQCRNVVADYNAAAQSYLTQDFRGTGFPPQIQPSDPTTDCQP